MKIESRVEGQEKTINLPVELPGEPRTAYDMPHV